MTKQKRITKILCLALLFLIGGQILLSAFSLRARAATQSSFIDSYKNTDIIEELKQLGVENRIANENGEVEIVAMYEYAYSTDLDNSDFYNLYFYVYNPTGKSIELDSENKVSIQCFDNSTVSVRKLEYCNSTNDRLYYKFRLYSPKKIYTDMKSLCAEKKTENREYNITGIQLKWSGESKVKDIKVSKKYIYSGYAAYCTAAKVGTSTLECNFIGIDSISLELNTTFYRFANKSSDGAYELHDDLTSVYFSVPEEYFEKYGGLTSVSTSWYEYLTKPIFVTSDPNGAELFEYLNRPVGEIDTSQDYWRVFWDLELVSALYNKYKFHQHYMGNSEVEETFNLATGDQFFGVSGTESLPKIDWLFQVSNVEKPEDFIISSETLLAYMREYTRRFPEQAKILGLYAEELFITDFENTAYIICKEILDKYNTGERKFGLNEFVFSNVDENGNPKFFEYLDIESNPNWFESFFGTEDLEKKSVLPLQFFSENDTYLLSDEDFAEKYYVFDTDVKKVKKYVQDSFANGEIPVIMHIAVTDYYASTAKFDKTGNDEISKDDGYVAQETVFLNFDVISLEFIAEENNNIKKSIIGVVASPIDIINALTAPKELVEDQEWWQKIMMILMIILLVILLVFLGGPLGFIFKVIWTGIITIISLVWKATCFVLKIPFSILGFIFKRR